MRSGLRALLAGVVATGLVVAAGAGLADASGVKAAATPSPLYVKPCSSTTGTGSWTAPFCTFAAAEAAVQPGQTVLVEPGSYEQTLNITRSGTAGAPITFQAVDTRAQQVLMNAGGSIKNVPMISVSGAHDVVVRGFTAYGLSTAAAQGGVPSDGIAVSSSSDVTLDQDGVELTRGLSAVHVSGSSSHVTITRLIADDATSDTYPTAPAIQVDAGASNLVVAGNDVYGSGAAAGGISVTGVTGAEITGNTVMGNCSSDIAVGSGASGATVENNIVDSSAQATFNSETACPAPASAPAISVASGSTTGTVVDHNLVDPAAGTPLYSWAGTPYSTLAAFRTASGQGAHDVAANPQLHSVTYAVPPYQVPAATAAIDSADASAPGEPSTDLFGNGRADDPDVANAGSGYTDLGAFEDLGPTTVNADPAVLKHVSGGGPLDTVVDGAPTTSWTHTGPIGVTDYTYADGSPDVVTQTPGVTHTYAKAGQQCVQVASSYDDFRSTLEPGVGSVCQVFGADYTPITPVRILNTRSKVGVSTTTPIAAGGTLTVPLPSVNSVPASQISAVVVNVTDTGPTAAGGVTVYAAGKSDPGVADVNFATGETRADLVTVPMSTGITVHNTSKGTVHVILDVEGYYGASGSGYEPVTPVRLLHTTTGLGTGGVKAPLAAGGSLTVTLSPTVPATATAAALEVTVTSTAAGGLTLYPAGQTRPVPYDVDFPAKANVTSLVLARLSGGKVTFYNSSTSPVDLAADLQGFYGPASTGAVDAYVPYGPVRVHDSGTGAQVGAGNAIGADLASTSTGCTPGCATPQAYALTVTASAPKAAGALISYPYGVTRPTIPTVSYGSGQTVSNTRMSAIPGSAYYQEKVYVDSTGSARVIVDEQGYFVAAS